ncbi:MAG: glycosyltransferase [Candidatus Limnocylindrales bacterium]
MIGTPRPADDPTVAIVHDYFTQRGGAERVAERLAGLFPAAPVYASVVDAVALPRSLAGGRVRTTALQRSRSAGLPLRAIAPFLAPAFARLDLGGPDVVISSSSAFAHHVRTPSTAIHLCYCHTPPRFVWRPDEYFHGEPLQRLALRPGLAVVRRLDIRAARNVDVYIANSGATAARIAEAYGRRAIVIPPPIETWRFRPSTERTGRFLVVSRLRPHKRIDLAIEAAGKTGLPLDIVGEGPDESRLRRLAGPTVRFLGWLPPAEVADAMARCAGLVVPAGEDFGMTIAEVQAAGRPPIAFAEGGALEIVRDGVTGFLVREPTGLAVGEGMLRASRISLDPDPLVRSARRFDAHRFDAAIRAVVADAIEARRTMCHRPIELGSTVTGSTPAARRAS